MGDIPKAEYEAMRRLCEPLMKAANQMTGQELADAMRGFYATTQTNCPWYAYALRHALPPLLSLIGESKEGYKEAWNGVEKDP